jgi:AraC family carnitine catabolism transcriptional activator
MAAPTLRPDGGPPVFAFILQPEFTIHAAILASEVLRIANQNSGRELFRWQFVSQDGEPVHASNGMWLSADSDLRSMPPADYYFVFEGNLPTQRNTPGLLSQLRSAARFGASVGGVDTGSFALAQAGLLEGRAAALHWEAVASFRERFPEVAIADRLYAIDGTRITCGGGVATLDMMLDLIGRLTSPALADEVANALLHTRRDGHLPQRNDMVPRAQTRLADRLVALMEQNLDFPLSLEELAGELGLSAKTILRECRRRFGETPMRLYLKVRLQAARNMLFYEEFSIKDVATACGFSYPTVFSRAFKEQFAETPREFRRQLRSRQDQSLRPEMRRLFRAPLAEQVESPARHQQPESV